MKCWVQCIIYSMPFENILFYCILQRWIRVGERKMSTIWAESRIRKQHWGRNEVSWISVVYIISWGTIRGAFPRGLHQWLARSKGVYEKLLCTKGISKRNMSWKLYVLSAIVRDLQYFWQLIPFVTQPLLVIRYQILVILAKDLIIRTSAKLEQAWFEYLHILRYLVSTIVNQHRKLGFLFH